MQGYGVTQTLAQCCGDVASSSSTAAAGDLGGVPLVDGEFLLDHVWPAGDHGPRDQPLGEGVSKFEVAARVAKRVDDASAAKISRDVAKEIEEQMTYPGEIRVTVLREVRAVALAR